MNYNGIYTGIVVDNFGKKCPGEVPSGKVLVHIDGITPTKYTKQMYKGLPSSSVKGTLDVDNTKRFQVLATVMMPVVNESSPSIYNANTGANSPTREVPANQYKHFSQELRDRNSDQTKNVLTKNNPNGHSYAPSYSNTGGLGVFAVPEPGTRVRIMFENGNLGSPIVIGVVNTSDEFSANFKVGEAYPGLPFAAQNYIKKGSGSDSGGSGSGKSSTDQFKALGDEDYAIAQKLATNISPAEEKRLLARSEEIKNERIALSRSASDADRRVMANNLADDLDRKADFMESIGL